MSEAFAKPGPVKNAEAVRPVSAGADWLVGARQIESEGSRNGIESLVWRVKFPKPQGSISAGNLRLTRHATRRRLPPMNARLRCFGLLAIMVLNCVPAAPAATNQPAGFRLTVELRDGSRVIGKSLDKKFEFNSAILGELKLPLEKIRAVESLAKTNFVKLTTASDDSLTVAFAAKEIRVETTYGEVKLPVAMIKSIRVTMPGKTGRLRDGLIGLWSGEGNAVDSVGGNNGVMQNVGFTDGVVGQAFTFAPDNFPYGTYTGVQIPDRPAYALTKSLTIAGWVRPRGNGYVIFFRGDHRMGLDPYCLSLDGHLNLTFGVCAEDTASASVKTPVGLGAWIHVAGVLDDDTGTMSLYTNGVLAAQLVTIVRPFGALQPDESPGIGLGNVNDGGNNFPFIGDLDEMALYDRALSADEVYASYAEHAADAGARAEPLPARSNSRRPMRNGFRGFNSD